MQAEGDQFAQPLPRAVGVIDPRINLDKSFMVPVIQGPRVVRPVSVSAQSLSNSNITFQENIPANVLVDRRMNIKTVFDVSLAGTVGAGNLFVLQAGAPRAFPLHMVTNTVNLQLNNASFSSNPLLNLDALCHYFNAEDYRKSLTGCPAMLDQSTSYADASATSERNPFAEYLSNTYQSPRGLQNVYFTITSNTPTASVIRVTSIEPIFCSPLHWGSVDKPAFCNLQTMQITYNLADLARVWSQNTTGITNYTCSASLVSAELQYTLIDPPSDLQIDPMTSAYYDVYNFTSYSSPAVSLGSGLQTTITTNNIIPPAVPLRMYIHVRRSNATRNSTTTDTFARIDSIKITWNAYDFLSGAKTHQLYEMSLRNGLCDSYAQWYYWTGSVLCLEFGSDLGFGSGLIAPGMSKQINLTAQITFTNTSSGTISYEPYLTVVLAGMMQLKQNFGNYIVAPIEDSDLYDLATREFLTFDDISDSRYYGGSVFSRVWSGLKKGAQAVRRVVEQAPRYARAVGAVSRSIGQNVPMLRPYADEVADISERIAKMGDGMPSGGLIVGGGRRKRKVKGGYLPEHIQDIQARLSAE